MKAILRIAYQQIKNTIKHSNKRQYPLFLLLGIGIIGVMAFFFIKVFGFLYYENQFPPFFKLFISEKILLMTFLTMFMMLILSTLISTLNMFFLSRDLDLLLSSPLPSRTVFIAKGLEVATASSIMVVLFSLPIMFAYCWFFAPGIMDIAAIIVVFLMFIVSAVLLGILIGMIIPAFFSVRKLQPVLSLVSILLISSIVIFLRLLRPERFGNPDVINNLLNYMSGLKVDFLSYFPFSWLSKSIHSVSSGNYWGYGKAVLAFAIVILILTVFTRFLQKRYYLVLYDKINQGGRGVYRSSWKKPFFLKGVYAALWNKEVKTFLRTPAQWSQLLIIGAIMVVFILNIKGIPLPHPSFQKIVAYLNLGMAAFVVAGLNSRFSFTTIPMESPGIIHLMASPFERQKLYRFKLYFFAIPQLLIGFMLFFTGDISLKLDAFSRLSGVLFLLPVLPFLTVLSLYFSLKVDERVPLTPQHLVASRNGISFMLWSLVYIVGGMAYIFRPIYIYYRSQFLSGPVPTFEIVAWFGVFILLNVGLTAFFYKRSIMLWRNREF